MTWIIRIISVGTVLKEPFNDPLRISPLGGGLNDSQSFTFQQLLI